MRGCNNTHCNGCCCNVTRTYLACSDCYGEDIFMETAILVGLLKEVVIAAIIPEIPMDMFAVMS